MSAVVPSRIVYGEFVARFENGIHLVNAWYDPAGRLSNSQVAAPLPLPAG